MIAAKSHSTPDYAAYVDDLFFHQTAGRYLHSWDHANPFWFYLVVITASWLPLSFAYIPAIPAWWRDVRDGEARMMFPLAFVVMFIVFFSFPTGKRDVYLLPALPMLALAIGPYLPEIVARKWIRLTAFFVALLGACVLIGLGAWSLLTHFPAAEKFVATARTARSGLDRLAHAHRDRLLDAHQRARVPSTSRRECATRRARRHVADLEHLGVSDAQRRELGGRRDASRA